MPPRNSTHPSHRCMLQRACNKLSSYCSADTQTQHRSTPSASCRLLRVATHRQFYQNRITAHIALPMTQQLHKTPTLQQASKAQLAYETRPTLQTTMQWRAVNLPDCRMSHTDYHAANWQLPCPHPQAFAASSASYLCTAHPGDVPGLSTYTLTKLAGGRQLAVFTDMLHYGRCCAQTCQRIAQSADGAEVA
jgi:hypothetical protein